VRQIQVNSSNPKPRAFDIISLRFLAVLLLTLSLPAHLHGRQGVTPGGTSGVDSLSAALAHGDTLFFRDQTPRESLEAYREILDEYPGEYEALWRASRSSLVLAILEDEWEVKKDWFRQGEAYAREALEARPNDPEALYWLSANLGRWAQKETGPREALRLAKEVRSTVEPLLELDPDHPGGNNVLGMFHFEILRMTRVERAVARVLAPSALRGVSWTDAERHLGRAAALDTRSILFQRDYAQALLWHGDTLSCREILAEAARLPLTYPSDFKFMGEVEALQQSAGVRR
jgi:tetratricopeptide (TPR) repeat protein